MSQLPTTAASGETGTEAKPIESGNLRSFCHAEGQASMQCLEQFGYGNTKCDAFFEAYKECKKRWNQVRAAERKRFNEETGYGFKHN